jgi:hypothetical protein
MLRLSFVALLFTACVAAAPTVSEGTRQWRLECAGGDVEERDMANIWLFQRISYGGAPAGDKLIVERVPAYEADQMDSWTALGR